MQTTLKTQDTKPQTTLYLALELSCDKWLLGFATEPGQRPSTVSIPALEISRLWREISKAKRRFKVSPDTPLVCLYEAGRDGFVLQRLLACEGHVCYVADSACILVNQRKRRTKSDGIDLRGLLKVLIQFHRGEEDQKVRMVNVPSAAVEAARHPHREKQALTDERTRLGNSIQALLAEWGARWLVNGRLLTHLSSLRQLDGTPLPATVIAQITRTFERWKLVSKQIAAVEKQIESEVQNEDTSDGVRMRKLVLLRGIGAYTAALLVREIFGWRAIRNNGQLTALAGFDPVGQQSGKMNKDLGISKAGNRFVRWVMVQVAWLWLRYQPDSALTKWYYQKFSGGRRPRKVGIVALANKLLHALWRWQEFDELPAGAVLKEAKKKRQSRPKPLTKKAGGTAAGGNAGQNGDTSAA